MYEVLLGHPWVCKCFKLLGMWLDDSPMCVVYSGKPKWSKTFLILKLDHPLPLPRHPHITYTSHPSNLHPSAHHPVLLHLCPNQLQFQEKSVILNIDKEISWLDINTKLKMQKKTKKKDQSKFLTFGLGGVNHISQSKSPSVHGSNMMCIWRNKSKDNQKYFGQLNLKNIRRRGLQF